MLILLDHNVDLTITDSQFSLNPLGYALFLKNTAIYQSLMQFLLKTKDTNMIRKVLNNQDKDSNTVLHLANLYKFSLILKNLLALPPNIAVDATIKNKDGLDYIDILHKREKEEQLEKETELKLRDDDRAHRKKVAQQRRAEERMLAHEKQLIEDEERKKKEYEISLVKSRGKIFFFIVVVVVFLLSYYLQGKIDERLVKKNKYY